MGGNQQMKFKTSKLLLQSSINRISGALSDKTVSFLSLKVDAEKKNVTLHAHDRILAIYANFSAEIMEEGVIHLPAKIFMDLAREIPEGMVRLESKDQYCHVIAGERDRFSMKIPLFKDYQWWEKPVFQTDNRGVIDQFKLLYALDQISYSIEEECVRNYGRVAYIFKTEEGKVRLISSDGFKFAICDLEMEVSSAFLREGICIPKKGINELYRLSGMGDDKIDISISPELTHIYGHQDQFQLFIRLSNVTFPYYNERETFKLPRHTVEVNRAEFLNSLRRVMLASDKNKSINLFIEKDKIKLITKGEDGLDGFEEYPLENSSGIIKEEKFVMNGKYFLDIFSVIRSEKVIFEFSNHQEKFLIKPKDEPIGCKSLHSLVPIKEREISDDQVK